MRVANASLIDTNDLDLNFLYIYEICMMQCFQKGYITQLVCFTYIIFNFVDTPRNFIIAKLSIRKPGSSSVPIKSDLF